MRKLWDIITVWLFAFIDNKQYRTKVIVDIILFVSSLIVFCESMFLAQGGRLSPYGLFGLIVILTLALYVATEIIKINRRERKADSKPAAIHRIDSILYYLNKLVKCKEK